MSIFNAASRVCADDLWGRVSFYAAALLSGRLPGCCVVMEQVNTLRGFGLGTELNWVFGPNRALTSWNGALELLLYWFKIYCFAAAADI